MKIWRALLIIVRHRWRKAIEDARHCPDCLSELEWTNQITGNFYYCPNEKQHAR